MTALAATETTDPMRHKAATLAPRPTTADELIAQALRRFDFERFDKSLHRWAERKN